MGFALDLETGRTVVMKPHLFTAEDLFKKENLTLLMMVVMETVKCSHLMVSGSSRLLTHLICWIRKSPAAQPTARSRIIYSLQCNLGLSCRESGHIIQRVLKPKSKISKEQSFVGSSH